MSPPLKAGFKTGFYVTRLRGAGHGLIVTASATLKRGLGNLSRSLVRRMRVSSSAPFGTSIQRFWQT